MPITLDRRPMGLYSFGVFLTSLGSTLCTESELKSEWAPGNVPLSEVLSYAVVGPRRSLAEAVCFLFQDNEYEKSHFD
jgi:hypothetical protein